MRVGENKLDAGIPRLNKEFGYSLDRVDEFAFYELKTEISVFDLDLLVQTFVPQPFLFKNWVDVGVEELLTSWGLVFILIQPLCDLTISQTIIMEVLDDIVQFGLVVGVRVDEEISSGQNHLETEEYIDVIGGWITPTLETIPPLHF